MPNTVLFFFGVIGVTFLIADASILSKPRRWVTRIAFFDAMFKCYFCTACWVGAGLWCLFGPIRLLSESQVIGFALLYIFGAAIASFLFQKLINVLEGLEVIQQLSVQKTLRYKKREEIDTSTIFTLGESDDS